MPEDGEEHRKAPRRPVFGNAVIRGPNLHADCVIRDLSASGAKLQVRSSVQLPQEFNLFLADANTSRHVVLKWRAGDYAGVAFSQIDGHASSVDAEVHAKSAPKSSSLSRKSSPPAPGTVRAGPDMRVAPRRRVLGHCLVVAPGLRASGIVRDVSATGARLGIASHVKLPSEFHVVDPKTSSSRRVALRWRDGDLAGVQFCEPSPQKSRSDPTDQMPSIWHV